MAKKTKAPKKLPHEDDVRAIRRVCRGPRTKAGDKAVSELLERGDLKAAKKADRANREPCGYDVNSLILSEALDGKDHEKECPGCGRLVKWRAPVFDEAGAV